MCFDIDDEEEFFQKRLRAHDLRLEAKKRLTTEIFIASKMGDLYSTGEMSM